MHGGGCGGVGMQGPRLRVLLLLSAYVPGDVALADCNGVVTHDLTHCTKGGRVARSLVARGGEGAQWLRRRVYSCISGVGAEGDAKITRKQG